MIELLRFTGSDFIVTDVVGIGNNTDNFFRIFVVNAALTGFEHSASQENVEMNVSTLII